MRVKTLGSDEYFVKNLIFFEKYMKIENFHYFQ